jgi:hypothetical protein
MNRESNLETRNRRLETRKWPIVWMTKRPALLSALAALVFTIATCSHPQGNFTPVRLATDLEPLRADFNRDAGQVRLVLLVDPT